MGKLLLIGLLLLASSSFARDRKCFDEDIVVAEEGEDLTFVDENGLAMPKSCHITHKPENQNDNECCLQSDNECEPFKNKHHHLMKCPHHQPRADHEKPVTCLTIRCLKKEHSGWYSVYDHAGTEITGCHLKVQVKESNSWMIAALCLGALLVLVLLVVGLICIQKRSISNPVQLDDYGKNRYRGG